MPAVAEPPKKSGPRAPIVVLTDLGQRSRVQNNSTSLLGVLGKPESSMNLFRIGSQSQTLQITTVFNIHIKDYKAEDLSFDITNQLFQTYKTISVIQPQQRDNITLTLFISHKLVPCPKAIHHSSSSSTSNTDMQQGPKQACTCDSPATRVNKP